jgi:4-hydroxybenzoyl-CoA thioesterase
MGDEVVLALSVERLGEKSMTVHFEVRGADAQPRVETRQVMVCTNLETHRSTPFPPDVRAAIESFMQES